GRQITGATVLGLIVLLISGLVLRWPRRASSAALWLKPQWRLSGRGLHRSLHSVIGTWLLPIYLVIALSGLSYSYVWYKDGLTWLLSTKPPAAPKPARGERDASPASQQPLALDLVWATALREAGDRYITLDLMLPAGGAAAVRVRSWLDETHDIRDEFRIDAGTGRLIAAERYADKSTGERVLARVFDIHRGSMLGWPGRILFMLAAATMPLFAVTGLLLYMSRRRLRRPPQPVRTVRLVPGE
ncbi:MAG: PepSY-associated TM helix domain-containing protein, partial [Bradyrhizobium sp.]|nr:PepSY-associated TM helix domain-containing protein [Bradyrhizobium sp.]